MQASVTAAGTCWEASNVAQISECSCPNGEAVVVAVTATARREDAEPCLP